MLTLNIITTLLEQRNLSIKDFSKHIGVSPQSIKRIIKNNSTRIQTLERIANELNVPISIFFSKTSSNHTQIKPHIPIAAQAGSLGSYSQPFQQNDCDQYHIIPGFAKYDFTITVQGNSMTPDYHEGDIVACQFVSDFHNISSKETYLLDCCEGIVIKKIRISDELLQNECIECISINPLYKAFKVSIEDIYTLAKVVGVIKSF